MKTLRRLFFPVVMLLSLFVFATAFADADTSAAATSSTPPVALPSGWAGFAILVLTVGSYLARKLTRTASGKFAAFLHSAGGATLTGFLGAVIPLVTQSLQHGFNLLALEAAVIGGAFNFMAMDNASNSSDEQKDKVATMKVPTKLAALFLPLFFFGAMGCSPVFKQCIAKSGIANAGSIENQVMSILGHAIDSTSVTAALENVATAALPILGQDVYVAVECAIDSWKAKNPLPKNASPAPALLAAHKGADQFIAKHFGTQTSARLHTAL